VITFLAFSFLIKNQELSLLYSFFTSTATFFVLYVLIKRNLPHLEINVSNRFFNYFFILSLLVSTVVLIFTPRIELIIYNESISSVFKNFSALITLQLLAAYFIVFFVPGIVIHKTWFGSIHLTFLEKIGIWILISFIFSVITTLILLFFDIFSIEFYLAIIWSVVIYSILKNGKRSFRDKSIFKFEFSDILIVITVFAIVIFSYYMLFTENLFAGLTSGDLSRYPSQANGIANLKEMARLPYVWWSIPYWIISSLTGIPLFYGFVFSSFLIILLPAGTHYFIRCIFPAKKNLVSVTTLFLYLGLGLTVVFPLFSFITDSSSFSDYVTQSSNLEVLNDFFNKTGAPGFTQQFLQPSPSIIDISILAYISGFYYYQTKQGKDIKRSILIAILLSSSIFIHSFNTAILFIILMLLFPLVKKEYARVTLQIIVFSIVLILFFEIISGFFSYRKDSIYRTSSLDVCRCC